jgi:hypothetical protein
VAVELDQTIVITVVKVLQAQPTLVVAAEQVIALPAVMADLV